MSTTEVETVWFRNKAQGTIHEVLRGSDIHKRVAREMTEVDEESGEVPEPIYERLTAGDLRKVQESPEKIPGHPKPRKSKTVAAGGVDIDALVAARVDAAVTAAVQAALAAQAEVENLRPPVPQASTPTPPAK